MLVRKNNGKTEPYSNDKVLRSLEKAAKDSSYDIHGLRSVADRVLSLAEASKEEVLKTSDIHVFVIDELRRQARNTNDDTYVKISNQYLMNHLMERSENGPISVVTKRNGYQQTADVSKIVKKAMLATEGVEGVSSTELLVDLHVRMRNGITTEELHRVMEESAVDKISEEASGWTYVAARLRLDELYHKVGKKYGTKKGSPYPPFKQYVEMAMNTGKFHESFWKKYDLDKVDSWIDPERDKNFTYIGVVTYQTRYALRDGNEVIELPQHLFAAVAMYLASNEDDPEYWAKRFYDVLSNMLVMNATPTLSGARTKRHQLSSCFVGSHDDSLKGIFDGYEEKAFLSKLGGGVGWDWSQTRASGSDIDRHKDVAKGPVPFLKIDNDIALAVDQLGTRNGAFAEYFQDWHLDILDVLKTRDNGGEERHRAQDIFLAMWISDEFMRREAADEYWTLFDPYDVPHLNELYGDDFVKAYVEAENNPKIKKTRLKARVVFKEIMSSLRKHGTPFVCFKDTANIRNKNKHAGIIRSSNLCTEIFQNTEPDRDMYDIMIEDETSQHGVRVFTLSEFETILTSDGEKRAKYVAVGDKIDGLPVISVTKYREEGTTAICNLASANFARITKLSDEEYDDVIYTAVRMLDNVIDLNLYPSEKIERTAKNTRAIGLGVMGEAEDIANRGIHFGSQEHEEYVKREYARFERASIRASQMLAEEKGAYPLWEGSEWEKPMRNGYLNAIAPTSTISILCGTTQCIEPVFQRKWIEDSKIGKIPVTAPNLSPANYSFYRPARNVDQMRLIEINGIRGQHIDQGVSMNIFVDPEEVNTGGKMARLYRMAWISGNKSVYYMRSKAPEEAEDVPVDRSFECSGCQ